MKYVLAVFGVVVMLIIAIVLIANNGRRDSTDTQIGERRVNITDYIDTPGSTVSYTQQGELVGEEQRRAVRITVTPTQRTFQVLAGFEETVISQETYGNNQAAYSTFVQALDVAGFSREQRSSVSDQPGACPLGQQYLFNMSVGTDTKVNTWATSCGRREGTFGGNISTVRQVFQNQIPNYSQLMKSVDL